MGFILGWLILLPFAGAWWLTIKIVDACIKKSDALRPLGILISLFVGGGSIVAGYFIGPIVGWFIMACGALVVIIGTWRSLAAAKEEVELEELTEKVEEERKRQGQKWAKEEAKKMLEQGKIDDHERLDSVCNILDDAKFDTQAFRLSDDLKKLRRGDKGAKTSSHVVDIIFVIIGIGLIIGASINNSSVMLIIGIIFTAIGILFFVLRRRYVKKGKFPESW